MIQINYEGVDKKILAAVLYVNNVLQSSHFYDSIRKHGRFDLSNIPPGWIADILESADISMHIDFYYSVHPFSKAIIADDPKDFNIIKLNRWNLNKPVEVLCNAIVHQCIHAVNALYPQYSFGHGNNTTEGKQNTAPYWIADLAQKIITGKDYADESIYHEEICDYSSIDSLVLQVKLQNSTWFQTCH